MRDVKCCSIMLIHKFEQEHASNWTYLGACQEMQSLVMRKRGRENETHKHRLMQCFTLFWPPTMQVSTQDSCPYPT